MTDAKAEYEQWRHRVQQAPRDPLAHFNFAWWAARLGQFSRAIKAYEQAIALGISEPEEAMTNIASIYSERLARAADAQAWLQQALQSNANYFPAVFNRAHLAEQLGDRDEAESGFTRACQLQPNNPLPVARLAEAIRLVRSSDSIVIQLRQLSEACEDPDVFYALARVEERLGNADAAWSALQTANRHDGKHSPTWPHELIKKRYDTLKEHRIEASSEAKGPVFIVGMFRTGSTLLEQILAAHTAFTPLGESEFWPRTIAASGGAMVVPGRVPDAQQLSIFCAQFGEHLIERGIDLSLRVTDKRPDNLYHLPLIAKAIPDARFIITERDWRDTLISVYGTRLHPQHGYATSPLRIKTQLEQCSSLAAHWQAMAPDRVRRFAYEDLVVKPESTMRGLLQWLGEAWEPGCLEFHKLTNPVLTASVWQVREPLSTAREGRWRQYEAPLQRIFGEDLYL